MYNHQVRGGTYAQLCVVLYPIDQLKGILVFVGVDAVDCAGGDIGPEAFDQGVLSVLGGEVCVMIQTRRDSNLAHLLPLDSCRLFCDRLCSRLHHLFIPIIINGNEFHSWPHSDRIRVNGSTASEATGLPKRQTIFGGSLGAVQMSLSGKMVRCPNKVAVECKIHKFN